MLRGWDRARHSKGHSLSGSGLWPGALGGTRTPNLLIRSQMLYPLSYERGCLVSLRHSGCALRQHFAAHSPAAARVAATDADMSSTTWLRLTALDT
jgi:hypothetical protein